VPLVEKNIKKQKQKQNFIPTSAKRQNRGKLAIFLCELLDTC
jgi:hypothetical protein